MNAGPTFSLHLVLIGSFLGCVLAGCCCNSSPKDIATKHGIAPKLHEQLMREDPVYGYIVEEGDYKTQAHRFLKRIRARYQAKELLAWAEKVLEAHKDDKVPYHMPHEETPGFILELDPPFEPFVTVLPKGYVLVDWGGGFGHWGLILAAKRPPDDPMLYTIHWVSGAYAYHTNQ